MRRPAVLKAHKVEQSAVVSFGALETNTSVSLLPFLTTKQIWAFDRPPLPLPPLRLTRADKYSSRSRQPRD